MQTIAVATFNTALPWQHLPPLLVLTTTTVSTDTLRHSPPLPPPDCHLCLPPKHAPSLWLVSGHVSTVEEVLKSRSIHIVVSVHSRANARQISIPLRRFSCAKKNPLYKQLREDGEKTDPTMPFCTTVEKVSQKLRKTLRYRAFLKILDKSSQKSLNCRTNIKNLATRQFPILGKHTCGKLFLTPDANTCTPDLKN